MIHFILCCVTLGGMVVFPRFTLAAILFYIGHPVLAVITIIWAIIWFFIKIS